MKVMRYDSSKELSSIQDELVSQSNTRQRIGRAGRVQAGEYYSILTASVRRALPQSITTEMQRSDLQATVLQLKSMQLDASSVLANTPEPPLASKVLDSLKRLQSLGAIDSDGHLTTKGTIMSKLPITPWISNLIIQGIIYKCLDPLLTIAAIISTDRSPFSYNPAYVTEARSFIRKNYANNSNSDQLTALNAVSHAFNLFPNLERHHPSEFEGLFLKKSSLINIQKAMAQYYTILEQSGIYSSDSQYDFNTFSNNAAYVKAIFGKCLYPNAGKLCAKNVYKGNTYRPMRLTGNSVNSYGAQCEPDQVIAAEEVIAPTATEDTIPQTKSEIKNQQKIAELAIVQASLDKHVWKFDSVKMTSTSNAPTFPKLLMYQELHQIESNLFMRSTSEMSPLSYLLLTNSRIFFDSRRMDDDSLFVDNWMEMIVDGKSRNTISKFKASLLNYENVVVDKLHESGGRKAVEGSEIHDLLSTLIAQ